MPTLLQWTQTHRQRQGGGGEGGEEDAAAAEAAGAAKEYLFKVFDVLGAEDDISKQGRRRLANLLLV